ncbi:DUF2087 domain-containing protein [Telmatospirillum sp.]|uniref:DUF2087 domain-containing protein n=1 Tax=Telmatospirillum sp. TaxID=2079197 RepID=UPI00284D195D|nr:DUF2087 domain-containing protein [Telmatospirillum sp.]MDR3440703.1 DUF2087 domain-containing protein [Telmatospirillum sp.]
MSRTLLPFHSEDISALARALHGQLAGCDHSPGHVELLNMLVRSAGYRNFQHFRADAAAHERLDQPAPTAVTPPVDFARVRQVLRMFDENGRLSLWPSKQSHQILCLWALWSMVPPRTPFTEIEISRYLKTRHLFGDPALLRRSLCGFGMMTRTTDGRQYLRIEQRPPDEALELIRRLQVVVPAV